MNPRDPERFATVLPMDPHRVARARARDARPNPPTGMSALDRALDPASDTARPQAPYAARIPCARR